MKIFNLDQNFDEKKELIEQLKNLINQDTSINEKYNQFKKIQNSWFKIGPVPRTKSGILWNNFQHHIKNFYDYLHLNRKFKEIDLVHNQKEKEKIISHAETLIKQNDKIKAFKDFERLKKRWKFELGPVNKEVEQNLNNSFNDIENKIIEEKKIFDLNKDSILENNIEKKLNLLNDIKILIEKETDSVKGWQKKINDFDKLKHNIEITGPIPKKSKKTFWNDYKKIVRTFYSEKNSFFKRLKKIYSENLEKQKNLINQVDNIHKEENLENFRSQVISIQKNWKLIKPVPYKANEKNWKLFKSTCDEYFQKLIHKKDNYSKEKNESNKKQKVIIENLNDFSGNEEDLVIVAKEFLSFKNISTENETKFYKKIKKILKDLGLNSKDIDDKISELTKFAPQACAGPLLAGELDALGRALSEPASPMVAVVGGSKVSTKLAVLERLSELCDQLLVGGGIANTFLAAAGYPVGKSLHEPDLIPTARALMAKTHIPLPVDVVVAKEFSETAEATVKLAAEVSEDDMILDVGPLSQQQMSEVLLGAGTILWNGPVGVFEFPAFAAGTRALATAVADSSATPTWH